MIWQLGQPRPTYDLVFRVVPASTPSFGYTLLIPDAAPLDDAAEEDAQWIIEFLSSAECCGACHAPPKAADVVRQVFSIADRNCFACHGLGFLGGSTAPGLFGAQWKHATDEASLRKIISDGLIEFGMPANPH